MASEIPTESDILDSVKNNANTMDCDEDEEMYDHDDGTISLRNDDIVMSF